MRVRSLLEVLPACAVEADVWVRTLGCVDVDRRLVHKVWDHHHHLHATPGELSEEGWHPHRRGMALAAGWDPAFRQTFACNVHFIPATCAHESRFAIQLSFGRVIQVSKNGLISADWPVF